MDEAITRKLERRRATVGREAVETVRRERARMLAWILAAIALLAPLVIFREPLAERLESAGIQPHLTMVALALVGGIFAILSWSAAYRLAQALESPSPWLWTIGLMVPGVNLLVLGTLVLAALDFEHKGRA